MNWISYSLLAAVLLAGHMLILRYSNVSAKISITLLSAYFWLIAGFLLLLFVFSQQESLSLSWSQWFFVFVTAVLFLLGALCLNKAVTIAPNPGYATAIGSLQVLLVVIASAIILNTSFSLLKLFASALVIIGVIILSL